MNSFIGVWIFVATAAQVIVSSEATVNVTVFYESLCPDSVAFIKDQLYPTFKIFEEFMHVEFVPFGKASYLTNPWLASCQHGKSECEGNILQACALKRYPENEKQVEFVHCVMSERHPSLAGKKCATQLKYSYDGIEECVKGEEGRKLFVKNGERTRAFRERLSFVPTILFNDVYTEVDQKAALHNLKSVICKKIEEPIPADCKSA